MIRLNLTREQAELALRGYSLQLKAVESAKKKDQSLGLRTPDHDRQIEVLRGSGSTYGMIESIEAMIANEDEWEMLRDAELEATVRLFLEDMKSAREDAAGPTPSAQLDIEEEAARAAAAELRAECLRLALLLALLGPEITVPVEIVESWQAEERAEVAAYAEARYRVAMGEEGVEMLPVPTALRLWQERMQGEDAPSDLRAFLRDLFNREPEPAADPSSPAAVVELLAALGCEVPLETVEGWTEGERMDVAMWATARRLHDAGTELQVPPVPEVVAPLLPAASEEQPADGDAGEEIPAAEPEAEGEPEEEDGEHGWYIAELGGKLEIRHKLLTLRYAAKDREHANALLQAMIEVSGPASYRKLRERFPERTPENESELSSLAETAAEFLATRDPERTPAEEDEGDAPDSGPTEFGGGFMDQDADGEEPWDQGPDAHYHPPAGEGESADPAPLLPITVFTVQGSRFPSVCVEDVRTGIRYGKGEWDVATCRTVALAWNQGEAAIIGDGEEVPVPEVEPEPTEASAPAGDVEAGGDAAAEPAGEPEAEPTAEEVPAPAARQAQLRYYLAPVDGDPDQRNIIDQSTGLIADTLPLADAVAEVRRLNGMGEAPAATPAGTLAAPGFDRAVRELALLPARDKEEARAIAEILVSWCARSADALWAPLGGGTATDAEVEAAVYATATAHPDTLTVPDFGTVRAPSPSPQGTSLSLYLNPSGRTEFLRGPRLVRWLRELFDIRTPDAS